MLESTLSIFDEIMEFKFYKCKEIINQRDGTNEYFRFFDPIR